MVDLAGIDQVITLSPAKIDAVPFGAIDGKLANGQRLALCAGILNPIVTAPRCVSTIGDFGDYAFQTDLAGMAVHLLAGGLETFAELNVRIGDQPFCGNRSH